MGEDECGAGDVADFAGAGGGGVGGGVSAMAGALACGGAGDPPCPVRAPADLESAGIPSKDLARRDFGLLAL